MISDSEFTDALFCSVAVEKRTLFIGKNTFASGKLKLLTNIQSLLSKFIDKEISVLYEHWLPWPGNFEDARKNEDKWTAEGAAYLKSMTSEIIQNQ